VIDAETYDSYLVPSLFEPWSRELIKRAKVWKGDRVLDVACRSGIVACRIAATGAAVTGIDVSTAFLDRARQRASEEGVGVKWLEGSIEALPIRQPAFELVTCQHGLQLAADRALAVREIRRVIVPGGRAAIATWAPLELQGPYAALAEVVTRFIGMNTFATAFSLTDAAALNKLLLDAKFFAIEIESVTRQVKIPDPRKFARVMLTHEVPPTDEIVAEGVAALAPFVDGDQLSFPMTALLAMARVKT
jgi:2-polyprenyl-3-methyl-5-hydroxy-6-metoxy-1,4-benzoquinol methylase